MTLRVLVVEDVDVLYEYFMNVCESLLPIEKFEFVNVQTAEAALEAIGGDWDVIVMDYFLGAVDLEEGGVNVRTGCDLIAHRRNLEEGDAGKKRACIIGVSGSRVYSKYLSDAGVDSVYLKANVSELVQQLKSLVDQE